MSRLSLVAAILLAVPPSAQAQEATLSPLLDRFVNRDTVITVWLFGVADASLDQLASAAVELGATVRRRSRWLHAVSAELPARTLPQARARREFRHIQPLARVRGRPEAPRAAPLPPRAPGAGPDSAYGPSAMPFRRLNLFPLVARGARGQGITIAVFDTGFETGNAAFDSALVAAQWDFVFDDPVVRNQPADAPNASAHGTSVWSLLAANVPGSIIGVAPAATYLLAKTEDIRSETRVEEDHWVAAVEWADSLGAHVIASSLGYLTFDGGLGYAPADLNGDIAVTTVAADSAAARGIAVIVSAGNGGPGFRTLGTPADGDSVLAVGSQDSIGTLSSFSSRGPTADRRLKPDVVAPGQAVFVVDPTSASGFGRADGTSFSAPLIAGAAALIRELQPTLSGVEVLGALRVAGDGRDRPDSLRGWGRPDAAAAAYFPLGVALTAPTDSILSSVTPTFSFIAPRVASAVAPITYRLRVAADSGFGTLLLDTSTTETSITIARIFKPGDKLLARVSVSAADSVTATGPISRAFRIPAWVQLTTFNDPAGATVRTLRPTFRWTSPPVVSPPGPFAYDLSVFRARDGEVDLTVTGLADVEYTPDVDLERNTPYRWRVTARLGADSTVTESLGTFIIVDDSAPAVTLLFQNFPNPFPNRSTGRTVTCLWFDLASAGEVRLDILDMRGHVVRNLVPGTVFPRSLPPGRYGRPGAATTELCDPRLEWDGIASDGTRLPRGIYVARLVTPVGTFFKRIVFMGFDF